MIRRIVGAGAVTLILAVICGCSSGPPRPNPSSSVQPLAQKADIPAPDLAATYRQLSQGGGQVFELDPGSSSIRIYVFRGGTAERLGHDHVIAAPHFTGLAYLPAAGLAKASFDLAFALQDLQVDDPGLRRETGGAFGEVLPAEAVQGTRDHMLGDRGLEASLFPQLQIHSISITGEFPQAAAQVRISLHGQSREQDVPLELSVADGHLDVRGGLVLKQSDYGLTPYSILGGLLSVQDAIVIKFKIEGTAIAAP